MKVSIFTLTSKGVFLGQRLLDIYDGANLYALEKFNTSLSKPYEDGFKETVKVHFDKSDVLIFICATGIVIRSIAELIKSKKTDPAIIVIDDNANNVISLLSGHIGGANDETIKIAKLLNSNPVITTASDVNNKPSVDMIAKYNNLKLVDFKAARDITARIVDGEKTLIIYDFKSGVESLEGTIDLPIKVSQSKLETKDYNSFIIISNKEHLDYLETKASVFLYPQNITIGIGCRRGISKDHILNMVKDSLKELNISIHSVKHIATVDVKSDEEGIIETCLELKIPLIIVKREDIKIIENRYEGSDFVEKTIGVRAVSEPCCELTSRQGKFLLKKHMVSGATISIWEENFNE